MYSTAFIVVNTCVSVSGAVLNARMEERGRDGTQSDQTLPDIFELLLVYYIFIFFSVSLTECFLDGPEQFEVVHQSLSFPSIVNKLTYRVIYELHNI